MKREIAVSLMCLMIVNGCTYLYDIEYSQNRNNLANLQLGMSKDQVKIIMGNPYQVEATEKKELWFYKTGFRQTPYGSYEGVSTPLSFKEGILEGWGQSFVIGEDVDKYEVRIR